LKFLVGKNLWRKLLDNAICVAVVLLCTSCALAPETATPTTTPAVWALLIVAIPFLGALTFWIVRPGGDPELPSASTEGSP
jgi:hypothetical protein